MRAGDSLWWEIFAPARRMANALLGRARMHLIEFVRRLYACLTRSRLIILTFGFRVPRVWGSSLGTLQQTSIDKKGKGFVMGKWVRLFVISIVGGTCVCGRVAAQLALSGAGYTQNFDSIGEGLPAGWSVWTGATESSPGAPASLETNVTSWASSSGQFRNCGSVTNNSGVLATNAGATTQHMFTNRVLAVRQGSSFADPGGAFVLQLAGTTGLSNLQFSVDFMMLDEESRVTVWTIDYGLGAGPVSFTTLGTYTNAGAPGTIARPDYVLGPEVNDQTEVVTIRIAALEGSSGSGSRDTFGLDNFELSYEGAAVGSASLFIAPVGGDVVLTWGDPAFSLQAGPAVGGPYTNVPGALSPYTNVVSGAQGYFRLLQP